jgi:hypothetical protein
MSILRRANDVTTRTMIVWALLGLALAFAFEGIETILFPHAKTLRVALEYSSTCVFWIGYIGLLAMLPVSVFRPLNRFSLHGDCRSRTQNFLLSLVSTALITLGIVLFAAHSL